LRFATLPWMVADGRATRTRRPRVAIGPQDVAGCAAALTLGLREHGVEAELVVSHAHPFGYPADRVLGRRQRPFYGFLSALRRDVLHYQFGSTWDIGFRDARWAGLLRRTRIVTYHGDDCRLYGLVSYLFPTLTGESPGDHVARLRLARLALFCDAAIVKDLELATYVYPFFDRVYLVPSPVLPPPDGTRRRNSDVPVVVHGPSDPIHKGTAQIRSAVERVARRRSVDFRVLTRVPHAELIEEVRGADVVVDQLGAVTTGVFALEAMQLGVPVLAEYDPNLLPSVQSDIPIVRVTSETLERELDALLGDERRRAELGERSREYVRRVHAPARVAAAILHVYGDARTAPPGLYEATADGIVAFRSGVTLDA
jgi:hypothetical protein